MPTPLAHSIVSLTIVEKRRSSHHRWKWVFFWLMLGNFADLDFIPGILVGKPSQYHHGLTHSILFTILLSIVAYFFYPKLFKKEKASFGLFVGVAFSHLLLDMVTRDAVAPCGLPLWWPFSSISVRAPFSIFLNVNRSVHCHILFSQHNLLAISLELAFTLPFYLLIYVQKRLKGKGIIPFSFVDFFHRYVNMKMVKKWNPHTK